MLEVGRIEAISCHNFLASWLGGRVVSAHAHSFRATDYALWWTRRATRAGWWGSGKRSRRHYHLVWPPRPVVMADTNTGIWSRGKKENQKSRPRGPNCSFNVGGPGLPAVCNSRSGCWGPNPKSGVSWGVLPTVETLIKRLDIRIHSPGSHMCQALSAGTGVMPDAKKNPKSDLKHSQVRKTNTNYSHVGREVWFKPKCSGMCRNSLPHTQSKNCHCNSNWSCNSKSPKLWVSWRDTFNMSSELYMILPAVKSGPAGRYPRVTPTKRNYELLICSVYK